MLYVLNLWHNISGSYRRYADEQIT